MALCYQRNVNDFYPINLLLPEIILWEVFAEHANHHPNVFIPLNYPLLFEIFEKYHMNSGTSKNHLFKLCKRLAAFLYMGITILPGT